MSKFTRKDLEQMTVRQLRLIDINSVDDEALVQEVLNSKMEVKNTSIDIHSKKDIATPEEEARVQAELDQRREAKLARSATQTTPVEQTPQDDGAIDQQPESSPESIQVAENYIDHVVTEEDIANNPELANEGIKVGETIQIPGELKNVELLTETELEKMKKDQLIEHAQLIGLEFGEDVTNNPQRVKAILEFQASISK